jgi:hypothetical protein
VPSAEYVVRVNTDFEALRTTLSCAAIWDTENPNNNDNMMCFAFMFLL